MQTLWGLVWLLAISHFCRAAYRIASPISHWKTFHLHKALNALEDDHPKARLHLDEFDRKDWEAAVEECPALKTDSPPSPDEIRSRYVTFVGGMI